MITKLVLILWLKCKQNLQMPITLLSLTERTWKKDKSTVKILLNGLSKETVIRKSAFNLMLASD